MSNRVNYLYSTDYKQYGIPQGISLSGQKNGSATSSYNYQPASGAKENISTSGQPVQTYYQQIQYSTQSGRTVQRTASPMIIQNPRYAQNNGTSSNSSNPSSANKYSIPSYQPNGTLSSEKTSAPNTIDPLSRTSINGSYIPQSQQANQFNNSQALRSPYVSSFTTTTASSTAGNGNSSNSNTNSTASTTHHGRSISVYSASAYTSPSIASSIVIGNNSQQGQIPSIHQSVPSSAVGGTGTSSNTGTNSSANSSSFTAVYSSLTANNKVGGLNSTQTNGTTAAIGTENGGRSISYAGSSTSPYTHVRASSTNTPQRIEDYYQQNNPSSNENLYRQDSLSPSKRVTFNLARNTYTDIEQIEKRLNESTRLRPAEEVEDSRDRTTTANFSQNVAYEDDLNKRFDQAIYRSERIISDCLRIGREGIQYKNALENSVAANNGSTTPTGPKMIRNPSRSKSPIKSSLKRTCSFTGSPQKSANTTPTAAGTANIGEQRFSDMIENPLTNQTNKVINGISSTEPIYSSKQVPQTILQTSIAQENQIKTPPQTGTITSTVSQSSNSSNIPPPSFLTQTKSSLISQNIEKPQLSATQTIYLGSSTQQVGSNNSIGSSSNIGGSTTATVNNNTSTTGVPDENRYISTQTTTIGNRLVTPVKTFTITPEAPQTSAFSVTSAYNTSNTASTSSSNVQKASYLQRSQTTKENDLVVPNQASSVNPNKLSTDYPSITLQKKSESDLDSQQKSQEKGQAVNDQKRFTQQYQAPVKPRQGILRYSDGSRYDGEILNNQRHGYGTLLSSEFQVIYQGDWQNDTYHGQGKFFNPMAENLFEEYDFSDFDIALSQYWESYEGEFYEGKLDGFGTLMLTNGEKLVGNFKKGRISGKGTFYCNKGPAVTGNWEDNRILEKY